MSRPSDVASAAELAIGDSFVHESKFGTRNCAVNLRGELTFLRFCGVLLQFFDLFGHRSGDPYPRIVHVPSREAHAGYSACFESCSVEHIFQCTNPAQSHT